MNKALYIHSPAFNKEAYTTAQINRPKNCKKVKSLTALFHPISRKSHSYSEMGDREAENKVLELEVNNAPRPARRRRASLDTRFSDFLIFPYSFGHCEHRHRVCDCR